MSDLASAIEKCQKTLPEPPKDTFADDMAMILKAMGIKACKSSSTSACVSSQVGLGFIGSQACAGTEDSVGCEALAANFKKTLIVKNAISCSLTSRINETSTKTIASNRIKMKFGTLKCCMCETQPGGCQKHDFETGQTTRYSCSAIEDINQENVVNVKAFSQFSAADATAVEKAVITAIAEDMAAIADSEKDGLGATASKAINVSQTEKLSTDRDTTLNETINKSLNSLTAENIIEQEYGDITSDGSCVKRINQKNIIDQVVSNIVSSSIESFKTSLDKDTLDTVISAASTSSSKGLDVGEGARAADMASRYTMVVAGIVIVIIAIAAIAFKKGITGSGMSLLSPKAKFIFFVKAALIGLISILVLYLIFKNI